ncbi:7TM diverse intracellular signaling domain-containing protein [Mucilaginibacter sp.]|uniref:7TM diverse intracellular signaling domain-containing protein n=1 Tax=Mucilaginibacter sp. TaxID=1882438 RepID=UPI003D110F6B
MPGIIVARPKFFRITFILIGCLLSSGFLQAQQQVAVNDQLSQHIFSYKEIYCLEDATGKLTFNDIQSPTLSAKFDASWSSTPQNYNLKSVYWYKITISYPLKTKKNWMLEFFDQTIDDITIYSPTESDTYQFEKFGALNKFNNRQFKHKNFELNLEAFPGKTCTYYFRIKSHQTADVIIVLRSVNWFIQYALNEYLLFGIFYGMILIFAFYNLIMYAVIKQTQYLYYVLYSLSVGFYELCSDGIGYQYLWPNLPGWNQYAYGVALCCVSVFALLFTSKLLFVKTRAPVLYKLINLVIAARIAFFLAAFILNKQWFNYKFIEAVPLCIAFFTGIYILRKGYRPARFFVVGYSFLFVGFTLKLLIMLDVWWLNFGALSYYSLSLCFILEMVFLAFANGDKVRLLKSDKEKAQQEIIEQLMANQQLKESINVKLEEQIKERTHELVKNARTIEKQNEDLNRVNQILQQQAADISRMNVLLEKDNQELHTNFDKVSRDRIMSAGVDFEEFSRIYPDADSCYKFLADLKWQDGYKCHKCDNTHFFNGHLPYSRRCNKCSYEESVTSYTLFQNTRIPITKAFYMIFLVYSTNGKISSHKLSEILSIRQGTCWAYSNRIKKLLSSRKAGIKNGNNEGWSKLVLENQPE